HHRDAVEGGVGDTRGGVGQPRAEMGEDHAGPPGGPGVPVGGMAGDLLVSDVDELDRRVLEGRQDGDVGVTAEPEDVTNSTLRQVPDEMLSNCVTATHA